MAYSSNDKQVEYCRLPLNSIGEYARIARVIPEKDSAEQSIDIRELYTDRASGEIRFSKSGFRLKGDNITEFALAMLHALTAEEYNEVIDKMNEENKATADTEPDTETPD